MIRYPFSRHTKSASRTFVGLLFILAVGAGCGRSPSPPPTPEAEKDAGEITFKSHLGFEGKDGEKVRFAGGKTSVALPEGFSDDVPIYPKATVTLSASEKNTKTVLLKTDDSAEKAELFYKKKLAELGWNIQNAMNTPQGAFLMSEKQGRKLTVAIASEPEGTVIQLAVVLPGNDG